MMTTKETASWETHVMTCIEHLCEEMKDFWQPLHSIHRVDVTELSPLEFHRNYVSKNVPVILTNAMTSSSWQHILSSWKEPEYLIQKAGQAQVTVDITPFGLGDAVLELDETDQKKELFIMPEERNMTLEEFFQIFQDRHGFDGVPYLSHQNDSLRVEFPDLAAEVPPFIEIAKEAFGNEPDAVNIWIGDERAVSSMHKDHYENMYCVVKGRKHFTLLPPAAIACLYETTYDSARYQHQTTSAYVSSDEPCTHAFHTKFPAFSSWNIVMEPSKDKTPWVPVDPFAIDISKYPLARHLKPIECIIEEGEILYLPAMWYHRATQLCETLSINYWHDMDFDCRYVYYNFVTQIANRIKK